MSNFYVSTSGDDSNQGSKHRPFLTIRKGISSLTAGEVLHLRGGNYVESVKIKHLHGSIAQPIVIRLTRNSTRRSMVACSTAV